MHPKICDRFLPVFLLFGSVMVETLRCVSVKLTFMCLCEAWAHHGTQRSIYRFEQTRWEKKILVCQESIGP